MRSSTALRRVLHIGVPTLQWCGVQEARTPRRSLCMVTVNALTPRRAAISSSDRTVSHVRRELGVPSHRSQLQKQARPTSRRLEMKQAAWDQLDALVEREGLGEPGAAVEWLLRTRG